MSDKNTTKTPEEYEKEIKFLRKQLNTALSSYDSLKAELELSKSQRSTFFSNLNHEIRTPMNSLLGYSDLILYEAEDKKLLEYAKSIKSASNKVLHIITDLIDLTNIETKTAFFNEREYSVETLIKTLVHTIELEANLKDIELNVHIDNNIPSWLFGDISHVNQIIYNILENAVKFTSKGYVSFDVSASVEDEIATLNFTVKDTGTGIKSSDITRIKEAIDNFDPAKSLITNAAGLGLTISNYYATKMDGYITFESKYGKGTNFLCSIKQKVISNTPLSLDFINQIERNSSKILTSPTAKVLIVDDSKVNLSVATNILKRFDIDADTITNGFDAIRMIEEERYDLVFMDHMMPDMDGVETTEKIRAKKGSYFKSLPIVALTANATDEARHMFMEHGFTDYMSKPIDKDIINDILYKWLPKSKISTKEDTSRTEKFKDKFTIAFEKTGIDIDLGLSYTGNDMDGYIKIIKSFIKESDTYVENLVNSCNEGDLKNYGIFSHGAKGALASIGAKNLSDYAKEHEFKAKEGNLEFVKKNYLELVNRIHHLALAVKDIVKSYDIDKNEKQIEKKNPITPAEISLSLNSAKENIADYEIDVALELLNNLKKHNISNDIFELLEDATDKLDNFDYDGAVDTINHISL